MTRRAALLVAVLAAAVAPSASAAAPRVTELVVFRNGSAVQKTTSTAATTVRVGRRHCAVPAATPLAALVRSRIGALRLKDYGSCSRRAADAAGLYVAAIRKDRARGVSGWVYKVANKVAPAGAADPNGPFGRGRLRAGARVMWFYCHLSARTNSCQRTLGVKAVAQGGGAVRVTVRSYDDNGRSRAAPGATVHAGGTTAKTGSDGSATLQLPPGAAKVYATQSGRVRSFEEAVDVT